MGFETKNPTAGLMERMAREGEWPQLTLAMPAGYAQSPQVRPVVTPGAFTTLATYRVPFGKVWLLLEANVYGDQGCAVAYQSGQSAYSGSTNQTVSSPFSGIPAGGGSKTWRFNGGLLLQENTFFSLGYTNPTAAGAFCCGGVVAIETQADLNHNAANVILLVCDSIGLAQTVTAGRNGWPFLMRDHLWGKGLDVRHVNKSITGLTVPMAQILANSETYYHCVMEPERVGLIIENLGMNDAVTGGTSTANYTAGLTNLYTSLLGYYRNAELLSVSHFGTNDVAGGRVANSAALRQAKQAWVAGLGDSRVSFADGTLAYGGSGGAGSTIALDGGINASLLNDGIIHPGDLGHPLIINNVIGPGIARTKFGKKFGSSW